MTRWVIFTSTPEAVTGLDRAAALLPGVRACSAGTDLPGSFGGLGLSGDLTTDGELSASAVRSLLRDATIDTKGDAKADAQVDAVPLAPVASRQVELSGPRVKRTLALAVRPGTPPETVARFEADLMAMPDHIATIHSWALSRVDATVESSRWTHVWEQEFADVDGLTGAYLLHPYHWTYVDRWFDSELPTSIVAPALAHVFRWAHAPVLTH
ncbi:Dabb family protein [Streptomyces sp. NBC_01306]|uniref:Dabb family protein n=1 Tax=Streptomyces sp. NBC_01306 TaxID=2903819 RepID=UPI002254C436|nr:Dabb family protein [Streptomyces sp. NBC_01306]MCX4725776.1 Dabb family protein [Streptomyces sp. NBC_01306]